MDDSAHGKMTLNNKRMIKYKSDIECLHVAIIHTQWNVEVIESLKKACLDRLKERGVRHITVMDVAGSFELPHAAQIYIESRKNVNVVICIGAVIKGETKHFEYISKCTSQGLMQVGLITKIPVIFGVLTCLTLEQAKKRAGLGSGSENLGTDWADTAIDQALFKVELSRTPM